MKYQEKKYLVDSFSKIRKILNQSDAKKDSKVITTHYYAQKEGNDVVKLIKFTDRNEIHILKESQGKFTLQENLPVESTDTGLRWLKDRGYNVINLVKMANTDYEYKNGTVGLYIIDDFLHSVILDYPAGHHEAIEKEFGLETARVINVPYNKLLEQMDHLRSMKLK